VELSGRHVELEIGTIVVEGLGRFDERDLAAGVRGELVRMVGAHGLPDGLHAAARTVRAPALEAPPGASGGALGAAVAQAVYGALGR
jgi:hypothetical protein